MKKQSGEEEAKKEKIKTMTAAPSQKGLRWDGSRTSRPAKRNRNGLRESDDPECGHH
jgi:hypothetical protein